MKGIEYFILRVGLVFLFWVVTAPVGFIAILVMQYLESHEQYENLKWALWPVLLVYIFGVPWFANKTAQNMAFENRKLGEAVKFAFSDLRLRLAFLPLVGHWFAPDDDSDDKNHDN